MTNKQFTQNIITWYKTHKRPLPWRDTRQPYFIWISEIILQQTRVAQGMPYYQRFVSTFPTLGALAQATEQEVLSVWQGLGYYSRARNMHKCAQVVMQQHGGVFPKSYSELQKLPGIGPYTAAAIASLAFNQPVPVVDGNVYRVLARVFGLQHNIAEGKSFKPFFELSSQLISSSQPADYNQGLMELGATVCTPQHPQCATCPVENLCYARAKNEQTKLPVKLKKQRNRHRFFNYLVVHYRGKMALHQRTQQDIWKGLHEFYNIETPTEATLDDLKDIFLNELMAFKPEIINEKQMPKHILSHQTLFTRFWQINISPQADVAALFTKNNLILYTKAEVETLPTPVLITNYLNSVS